MQVKKKVVKLYCAILRIAPYSYEIVYKEYGMRQMYISS